jgi:hypothetical protein
MKTGQQTAGTTDRGSRASRFYNEIHVLAEKIGLIVDADRTNYQAFSPSSSTGSTRQRIYR